MKKNSVQSVDVARKKNVCSTLADHTNTNNSYRKDTTPASYAQQRISEELKNIPLRELIAHRILEPADNFNENAQTGICCPFCNSGHGDNHTGAGQFNSNGTFYCHACHNEPAGGHAVSTIDLYMMTHNISNFSEAIKEMAEEFGIQPTGFTLSPEKPKKREDKKYQELLKIIREDINRAKLNLKTLPVNQRRGLSLETLTHFDCGFLKDWTHPNCRLRSYTGKAYISRRIIIPTSQRHYNAVMLECDRTPQNEEYWKQHTKDVELFNATALLSDSDVVVVVEGEFDAMSIWQASAGKIAVVGDISGNKNLLLDAIKKHGIKGKNFLILFDNDSGQKNAQILRAALFKLGHCAVSKIFDSAMTDDDRKSFNGKIDANQILQNRGDEFLNALTEKIIADARADFEPFNGYDFLAGTNFDLDNARRLEKYRGDLVRWLVDDENWILYEKGIWLRRSEKNACLYPFAEQFSDEMLTFAKKLDAKFKTLTQPTVLHKNWADKTPEEKIYDKAKDERDKAFDVAYYFQKRKNYSSAIDLMKGCTSLLITAADLNKNKNLLACQNGVVDLQTGKLYDFAPHFLITNQVAATYDAKADTSFVENFFAEVLPDEKTRRAVLRYLGYCLTGEKNFHISQFWRGTGANGKSTILDALIRLLASYAVKLPCAALLESNRPVDGNSATPAIALLDGDIRFALVDELPRNSRLNAALYKTITGDETIAARPLYGNFRNIELRAKIILNGNHLPTFDVVDGGLQRRINNVEFNQKFEGDRADSDLPKKLATPENRSALLKILVHEAIEYYKDGLLESDAMKAAKAAYFAESDFVSEFVDEYCDIGDGFILRKEFIDKLKSEHYADTRRLSNQELFKAVCDSLARNGVVYGKNRLNQNIFKGIRWRNPADFGGKDIAAKDYAMP